MMTDPSRRRFLGTATAAAAWPLLGRAATAESATSPVGDRGALKLGVASYSMREFTLDQALDMAKRLGVKYMTFKDVHVPRTDPPETTRALRAKIEAAGITIMGGGTITIPNDPAKIKKEFEYARNAGFPLIFVDPDPAALDTVEQMAKEYDIKVAIHNHGPENKHWPRPQDGYAAVKSRDKRLGLCIDVGHTARAGVDPADSILKCQERLYDLHMKDISALGDKNTPIEGGRGILDSKSILAAILKIKYQGLVGFEYEKDAKDPVPGLAESVGYIKGLLAGMK